jgi:argininosuccinate synthase
VTGTVRMKLYKGNAMISGRRSPYSLYNEGLASFGNDGSYDHADAAGFIHLFGLPTRTEALQRAKAETAAEPVAEPKVKVIA